MRLPIPAFSLDSKPTRWQVATLISGVACCAAFFITPRPEAELAQIFLYLFHTYDLPAATLCLTITLIAVFATDRHGKAQALFSWIGTHPGWISGIAFLGATLGAWFIYHAHPLSMDEYAPRLQSQIFATGHLTGQIPPHLASIFTAEWFQGWFIHVSHTNGMLASAYWPGLALVMTPFSLAGVPWLCNPVLTAATFMGLGRLLQQIVDDPSARGVALAATLVSPVILANGISYYGMPLQLLCAVMFTDAILRETRGYNLAAGAWATFGMTAVNPVPLILYCTPWVLWIAYRSPARVRSLLSLTAGSLPLALILGFGWKLFLTDTFSNPLVEDKGINLGSQLSILQLPAPSLLIARVIALAKLFLWAMPGLIILAALASRIPNRHRLSHVLIASALLTFMGYLFVPFDQGHGWGYRYFHAAWLCLPLLAATAIGQLGKSVPEGPRAYGFVLVTVLGSLLLILPLRAIQIESFITKHLQQIPPRIADDSRQVVFVRIGCGSYTADLVQNDPFLRGKEIRLVSQGYKVDGQVAASLGTNPRLATRGGCGDRWQLD